MTCAWRILLNSELIIDCVCVTSPISCQVFLLFPSFPTLGHLLPLLEKPSVKKAENVWIFKIWNLFTSSPWCLLWAYCLCLCPQLASIQLAPVASAHLSERSFLKSKKKTKKTQNFFFFHSLFSSSSTTCNLISASMAFLFSSLISSTSCLWLKFLDSSRVFQKSKKRWCWYDVNVPCVTLCCLSDKHTNKDLVSSFQMGQKSRRKHLQPCLLFLF